MKSTVEFFRTFDKSKPVRVFSHYDTDGICSATIILKLLDFYGFNYVISFLNMLTNSNLDKLSKENYDQYLFLDLGGGKAKKISTLFENKLVIILDHHQGTPINSQNIRTLNYYDKNISASGICYLFAKGCDLKFKHLSSLALIGAVGDKIKFVGLTQTILDDALKQHQIIIKKGLTLFGQTRAINKALEYTTDPFLEGITGNVEGCNTLLTGLNIDHNKKLNQLSEEEIKKIRSAVKFKTNQEIYGDIYLTKYFNKEIKEFSTILNASGRLNKPSLGVALCLDETYHSKIPALLLEYKRVLSELFYWYKNNHQNHNGLIITYLGNNYNPSLIGILASMISHNTKNKIILVVGDLDNENLKLSIRFNGDLDLDLREKSKLLLSKYEFGGHKHAVGAIVPKKDKNELIKKSIELLQL